MVRPGFHLEFAAHEPEVMSPIAAARELGRFAVGAIEPAVPLRFPGDWVEALDASGGPVTVDLVW